MVTKPSFYEDQTLYGMKINKMATKKRTRLLDITSYNEDLECQAICLEVSMQFSASPFAKLLGKVSNIQCVTGTITILLNVFIIGTVLNSRSLRKETQFVLICNMALCDTVIGIYSILNVGFSSFITIYNIDFLGIGLDNNRCTSLGFLVTTPILMEAFTGFFMTVDKFLVIEFPLLNHNRRLTRKHAIVSLVCSYCVVLAFSALPIVLPNSFSYQPDCFVPFPANNSRDSFLKLFSVLFVIPLLFFADLALFCRIVRVIRKSNAQFGRNREGSLARKIFILMLTNFVFSVAPILSYVFVVTSFVEFDISSEAFTFSLWLSPILLSLNSLINPYLYALRHERIKHEIAKNIQQWKQETFPVGSAERVNTTENTASRSSVQLLSFRPLENKAAIAFGNSSGIGSE